MEASESSRAQEAGRKSGTDYRGIFDAIDDAIFIHDVDTGDIVDVNRGMCQMFGYTREEAGRLNLGDLCGREPAQSLETMRRLIEKTAGGGSLIVEWRPVSRDGRRLWTEVNLKRFSVEGRERMLAVVRDISQRKQAQEALQESEARFRLVTEGSLAGVYIIQDFNFAYVNPTMGQIFGYEVGEILGGGVKPLDLVHPEDLPLVQENLRKRLEGEVKSLAYTFRGRRKDGMVIYCEVLGRAIEYQGRPAVMGTVVDRTERLKAEAALRSQTNLLNTVFSSAPEMLALKDHNFIYQTVNPALCRFLNKPVEEIVGKTDFGLFPREEAERSRQDDERVLAEGVPRFRDRELTGAAGKRWFQVIETPVLDGNGLPRGILCSITDISRRKQAEEALRETSNALQSLIQALPLAIVALDRDLKIMMWNPAAERIFGWKAAEVLERRIPIIPADQWEESAARIQREFQGEARSGLELRRLRKDGALLDVQLWNSPLRNARGEIVGNLGILADIRERKRAEEAVRASEAKYRNLVEQIPAITYISALDNVTCHIYVSPQIETFLGFSQDEWLANPESFKNQIHPEDRDRVLSELILSYSQGGPFTSEYRLRSRSGRVVWVRDESRAVYDAEGLPLFMQGVAVDISARKEAEQALRQANSRLQALVQASPLAIVSLDPEARVMSWNPAAERIFGWSSSEVIGRPLPYIQKEERKNFRRIYRRVLQGETLRGLELRRQRRDGSLVEVSLSTGPLYDAAGQIAGVMGVLEDISRRKKIEEALRQAREELEQRVAERTRELTQANLKLRREIEERRQREATIGAQRDLAIALSGKMGFQETLKLCTEAAMRVSGLDCGGVYLVDKASGAITLAYHTGFSPEFVRSVALYGPDSPNARLVTAGKPVYRRAGEMTALLEKQGLAEGLRAAAVIPVRHEGRVIASLNIASHVLEEVSESSRAPLEAIAAQIGSAIARVEAEEARQESEERFNAFMDHLPGVAFMMDAQDRLVYLNENLDRILRKIPDLQVPEDVRGKTNAELWPPEIAAKYSKENHLVLSQKQSLEFIQPLPQEDGLHSWLIHKFPILGQDGSPILVGGIGIDVTRLMQAEEELRQAKAELEAKVAQRTAQLEAANETLKMELEERRKTEEALRASEARFRAVFEGAGMGIVLADLQGKMTEINPALVGMLGYTPKEMRRLGIEGISHSDDWPVDAALYNELLAGRRNHYQLEKRYIHKNGDQVWGRLNVSLVRDAAGEPQFAIGMVEDVTERVRAEEAADEVRRQQAAILSNILDLAWLKDQESRFIAVNDPFGRACGVAPEKLVGKTDLDIWPRELARRYREDDREVMRTGQSKRVEEPLADKEGNIVWIETVKTPIFNEKGEVIGTTGIARDITRRREMEEALKKVSRALKAITECHQAMMRATREEELLNEVCRIIVEVGGYLMAWVGYAEHDRDQTVRPVAKKGFDAEYIHSIKVTWSETESGQGPVGMAIRKGSPDICRDTRVDPRFAPWRQQALERGYASLLALPLKHHQTLGALAIYAAEPNAFDDEEINLLMGLANDLAYGITALRAEAERQRAAEALRESEEKYRGLMDYSSDAILLADLAGNLTEANRRAEELLGYSKGELLTMHYTQVHPSEEFDHVRKVFAETKETGLGGTREVMALRKDRTRVPVDITGSVIEYSGKKVIQGILRDITARKEAEEALRESEGKLRLLTSQLLTVQERERRRVSRELHDELGQALTVLKIQLVAIETKLRHDQESLRGDCEQLLTYIDGVIENVRRLSWDLSPSILEDLGLTSSLGYLIDEICRSNNLSCSLVLGEIDPLFSPETRIHIYRIFQESLTNVVKHAGASHISVAMQQEGDHVTFRLRDNGSGFDQEKVLARETARRGLGLTAMNERALMAGGSLSIRSRTGQGTEITFRIPTDK